MLEKDLPSVLNIFEKTDPSASSQKVEAPANQVAEKQAARLIITRRKKMRKHKLKKLRKKMKFVWAKVRQKREYRKEKQFQAEQMAKVRRYDAFDAEEYVKDFLRQTKEKPIPKTWKSKHLPEFLIKELMKKEEEKKIKNRQERLKLEALQKIKDNYKSDLLMFPNLLRSKYHMEVPFSSPVPPSSTETQFQQISVYSLVEHTNEQTTRNTTQFNVRNASISSSLVDLCNNERN
ncbi:hypothetical protein E2C01_028256 [Portunus trituberculatus]|uniref:Ribosomal protein mS38 C-terminal domain-containing protein n=1 Tax=Portunus trituberculatus TaxID=210409 RepID=A0A5B7EPJ0_PORTR|nr:hypothetical protein [Portunus trituberculatus]